MGKIQSARLSPSWTGTVGHAPGPHDVVLADPLLSTTAYRNNLYSREFFQLVSDKMSPEGVFMVFLGEVHVMLRTMISVFPDVRLCGGQCIASNAPLVYDPRRHQELLDALTPAQRAGALAIPLVPYGDVSSVRRMTKSYPINRDWRPHCEYFLGPRLRACFRATPAKTDHK